MADDSSSTSPDSSDKPTAAGGDDPVVTKQDAADDAAKKTAEDVGAQPVDHDQPGVDKGYRPGTSAKKPPVQRSLFERALPRWGVVLGILAVLSAIYLQHPYYKGGTFTMWRSAFPMMVVAWVSLGLPYVVSTLRAFPQRKLWFTDTGLLWIVLVRVATGTRNFHVWKIKRLKNTILSLVVKAFFSPLMVGFFGGHVTSFTNRWLQLKGAPKMPNFPGHFSLAELKTHFAAVWATVSTAAPSAADFSALFNGATYTQANVRWGLDHAYDFVFMVDCGFALVGYLMESRWLGNKTKSVEPTGFGWAVALACYPPFNNILGTYMPFKDAATSHFGPTTQLWIRGGMVFLFAIYSAATVAFGPRFSNLTNRGIVTRGPYAFIRHPAYVCKCTAWWLEHANHMTLQTALALSALCSVYGWRAWTEERHLSMDPDYRAYKKKVPWVIFPKVY